MEFTVTCKCEANSIEELAAKLAQIEGNRRSRSHVQSVVGPQDAGVEPGESGRWPDRLMLSKLIVIVREEACRVTRESFGRGLEVRDIDSMCEGIIQRITNLAEAEGQDGL